VTRSLLARLVVPLTLSLESIELFHEEWLIRITHGGFAIWLNPFGVLNPQVVVNLLPKLL
jgi:hypothetical protein